MLTLVLVLSQAVKNACNSVARLLAASRTSSGEVPELKRFLGYFKKSQKGKVYMLWCAAAILLPSESISECLTPNHDDHAFDSHHGRLGSPC
eukprot:1055045-Rhodomonas_salina.5